MTLNDITAPLLKWWWLLLASSLIAAISSFIASSQQPPIYQSRATLMIGRAIEDPNPSSGELYLEQQLASTYANIANRELIRMSTMEALGLSWLPEYHVSALPQTQLLEIIVVDTNPQRAQAVAYELANQLILSSPSGDNEDEQERQRFVDDQLKTLQVQITETQFDIEDLQNQLGELNSARQIADTQNQILAQQNKLSSLQANYASLLANTQQGAVNVLTMIEPPNLPQRPTGPNVLLTTGLSVAVGFSLAAAAAYVLEYFDKSIQTVEEAAQIINAPVIGNIPKIPKKSTPWNYVSEEPRSPISDSFRAVRTNLEFTKAGNEIKTILVTGTTVSEGKSTIASNLARIIAQADKKVILLDADLRKSIIQEELGLQDRKGLSNTLSNQVELDDVMIPLEEGNISIIPAGDLPPNPSELLGSENFDQILGRLKKIADIIIVDGPPLLVTDAVILAAKVDGIIIVVQPGLTNKDIITAMTELLERINTPILGIVSNRDKKRSIYNNDYYYSNSTSP